MAYRILLVVLFLVALLLTLNERLQERRSQEIAIGGSWAPAVLGSGDAYPVSNPNAPTATAYSEAAGTPYPAPPR